MNNREQVDAYHYWRNYPVTVYWDKPMTVSGVLVELIDHKTGPNEFTPKLKLRGKDGQVFVVLAAQPRLVNELVRTAPAVGDMVKITYVGEAPRAAPGLSPAKEFTVAVRRAANDRAPERPGEDAPEQAPENAPAPTTEEAS